MRRMKIYMTLVSGQMGAFSRRTFIDGKLPSLLEYYPYIEGGGKADTHNVMDILGEQGEVVLYACPYPQRGITPTATVETHYVI